jgi:hypothetical protein
MCTLVEERSLNGDQIFGRILFCNANCLIRGFVILYGNIQGFLQPPSGKQTVRDVNTGSVKAASDLSVVELTVKYSSETNYK